MLEGMDDALRDLSAGESTTFEAPLAGGDRAGEASQVTVTVQSVKERQLPPLDDDFAQLASEFDTLPELKDDLRTRLAGYKRLQQGVEARDHVLEALLALVEVPLPENLVAAQIEGHFEDGHGDPGHRDEFETQTRQALTAQFVLDAIATKEELSVGEGELTEYIVRNAQRYGMTPDQFASEIVGAGQVPAVVGEVVRAKALALVLENAKVTDASGRVVDLSELQDEPGLTSAASAPAIADISADASADALDEDDDIEVDDDNDEGDDDNE
jgi:trigger factor